MTERAPQSHPTIGVLSGWGMYEMKLHSYFSDLLRGIRMAARHHECNLLIGGSLLHRATASNQVTAWGGWMMSPDESYLPIGPWNTDGLLVATPLYSEERDAYLRKLVDEGFPVVFVGEHNYGSRAHIDNADGIVQAMSHLVGHGHRRIAFIAGEYSPGFNNDSPVRLAAYQEFVRTHGLAADGRLTAYGFHVRDGGYHAMQQILESGVEFSAVVASNDESACGALQCLLDAGVRVPEDVSIIGMDDRLDARAMSPQLTTVHYSTTELGVQATNLLLQHIRGERDHNAVIKVPVTLTVRETCNCALRRGHGEAAEPTQTLIHASKLIHDTSAQQVLTHGITKEVKSHGSYLSFVEIENLAQIFVEGFANSLSTQHTSPFIGRLKNILNYAQSVDDTLHPWQAAVSVLQNSVAPGQSAQTVNFLHRLLHQARIVISQYIDKHLSTQKFEDNRQIDYMTRIADKFLSALDESSIVQIASEDLHPVGIRTAHIALFEGDSHDPVSWTRTLRPHERHVVRFKSQSFPPPELWNPEWNTGETFEFVLIPLMLDKERLGFIIFEADNIAHCGEIAVHVATAIRCARLYREATEGRRLAEAANQLKTRFLSMVSHELRTPLSQIVGLTDLLLYNLPSTITDTYRQDVEWIHANARHLNSLIADVMDLTREQIGEFKLNREPFDFLEGLSATLLIGRRLAEEKGLRWESIVPHTLPHVYGDRTRLRQVVLNLLTNAVKFTQRGGITLKVEVSGNEIVCSVSDTGCGVLVYEQESIFDEFQQAQRTRERGYSGLGLGLAISRQIVELHGGSIGVHSDGVEGSGATFFFTLPLIPSERRSVPPEQMPAAELVMEPYTGSEQSTEKQPCAAKSILIVDDQPEALQMHARLIETHAPHYEVICARGGEHALKIALRRHIDLILLDLQMPDLNGFEVIRALRSESQIRSIPVIVLTAQHLSEVEMEQLSNGGIAVVMQKGVFTVDEIFAHIEAALKKTARARNDKLKLVRSAMAYIHTHYSVSLTREQIASHVAVNADYLNRCFQQELGLSLMSYLTRYRISKAKDMLTSGRANVSDVATVVGFPNVAYFCRVFRREVGISPGVYQHQAIS